MDIRASAIVCAARAHGETGVIARLLTRDYGMVAGYVAGGRGRDMRPVLIPGNRVEAQIRARSASQLPFARLELLESRGPWMTEPLPAAGIAWVTALAAATLPEHQPVPALHDALAALLDAICLAPSARGWTLPMMSYEVLTLRELGYGVPVSRPDDTDWREIMTTFDQLGVHLERYLLADRQSDVMAARAMLRERLARI